MKLGKQSSKEQAHFSRNALDKFQQSFCKMSGRGVDLLKKSPMTDQPDLWKEGQGILLECEGEKFLAEIVMTSKNGISLMIAFKGTIHGHRNYMPVTYHGNGIYRSIIDGTEVRVRPLPKDIFK
jgi:hypothetical protein